MKKKNKVLMIVSIFIIVISAIVIIKNFSFKGDYIDSIVGKYNPQGAEIVLIKNGEVEDIRNYGYADVEKGLKVDNDTRFKIASISKTVTSFAVMKLVDEGKLDLDKPINSYLSKWKLPDSEFDEEKVTLRTLMSHTSGITGIADWNYDEYVPIEKLLKDQNLKLKREPGEVFEYSETAGFGICQLIIEEVSGMKFEDYMVREVFPRLNMRNTNYEDSAEEGQVLAIPYAGRNKPVKTSHMVSAGAGGVTTTGSDLAQFVINLIKYYNDSQSEMFIPQKNTKSQFGEYGLGIIPRKLENGKVVYEHNGTLIGYNAQIVFDPVSGDGLVVVTNSDKAYYLPYELMDKWGENTLGAAVKDPVMNEIMFSVKLCDVILLLIVTALFIRVIFRIKTKKIGIIDFRKNKMKIIVSAAISLILIIIYYLTFYSDIIFDKVFNFSNNYLFTFFPPSFKFINIGLLMILILINISAVYTKKIIAK